MGVAGLMDLRKVDIFANLKCLSTIKNYVLSKWIERGFFLPFSKLYNVSVCGPTYTSIYLEMLVSSLKNRVWGRGRICHGISLPSSEVFVVNKNTFICTDHNRFIPLYVFADL